MSARSDVHLVKVQEDLRRFYQRPRKGALCVESFRGPVELTRLGTPVDRTELEQMLKTEFLLREETTSSLPVCLKSQTSGPLH